MSTKKNANTKDILSIGLDTQQDCACLNKVATKIIKGRDFKHVLSLFHELLSFTGDEEESELIYVEKRMEDIQRELTAERIEILKEEKLLYGLRMTNDSYVKRFDDDVEEIALFLKTHQFSFNEYVGEKRTNELQTTKTVAISFSEHLKLSENGLHAMADRIGEIQTNVIPLLRGRIALRASNDTLEDAQKLLRENVSELKKLSK
ncbi:MAG: hypothetical protein J5546_08590 [Lachnospiraceae bacterium]|nr:hypothetical protein [Lachnospiraceae bacterium]